MGWFIMSIVLVLPLIFATRFDILTSTWNILPTISGPPGTFTHLAVSYTPLHPPARRTCLNHILPHSALVPHASINWTRRIVTLSLYSSHHLKSYQLYCTITES